MVDFAKRSITVMGEKVDLNTKVDLPIADVSVDMSKVAAQIGWWGSVWAAAEKERMQSEAHYRRWRAGMTNGILDSDPKLAEWKLRARIEADPKFIEFKDALAQAEENVVLAKNQVEAFKAKGNQLQSRGAMQRSELDATGMTTPERPKSAPMRSKMVDDETKRSTTSRDDAVRQKLKAKKAKK
jgi:hypothetical protein